MQNANSTIPSSQAQCDQREPGLDTITTSLTRTSHADSDCLRRARLKSALTFGAEGIERCVDDSRRRARRKIVMVTLTYAVDDAWEPWHITEYLHVEAMRLRRAGVEWAYQWVAEQTGRGRLHYHVLWYVPERCRIRMPDRAGLWKHGSTRTERARNAGGYIRKYVRDGALPSRRCFPAGVRIHGQALCREYAAGRLYRQQNCVPVWLREEVGGGVICRRERGGSRWIAAGRAWHSGYRVETAEMDRERGQWRYHFMRESEPWSVPLN